MYYLIPGSSLLITKYLYIIDDHSRLLAMANFQRAVTVLLFLLTQQINFSSSLTLNGVGQQFVTDFVKMKDFSIINFFLPTLQGKFFCCCCI